MELRSNWSQGINNRAETYSMRYFELAQFIFRGLAENQSALEARLAAIEAQLT